MQMHIEMGLGKAVLSKGKGGFPCGGNARPRLSQRAALWSLDRQGNSGVVWTFSYQYAPANLQASPPKSQHRLENSWQPQGEPKAHVWFKGQLWVPGAMPGWASISFRQRLFLAQQLCTPPGLPTQHKPSSVTSADVHSFPKSQN